LKHQETDLVEVMAQADSVPSILTTLKIQEVILLLLI
jgi:hypothetical protein